jgi:hypothetical protein
MHTFLKIEKRASSLPPVYTAVTKVTASFPALSNFILMHMHVQGSRKEEYATKRREKKRNFIVFDFFNFIIL